MDLWLTLRDGRTAPLTGVTSISSIDTVGTATAFLASAIASGSPNVTVSDTTGIRPGSMVYGSGIPTGATVISITSGTVFVMSTNATATIGSLTITVAVVSTADQKLLTVNSGWYRDIFSSQLQAASVSGLNSYSGPGTNQDFSIVGNVWAVTTTLESDEVAHELLRQATWYESLWAFSCTVGAETLVLYYRKYDVIGQCNVAPSL